MPTHYILVVTGQMEITFMTRVARAMNLRPVLKHPALKEVIGDAIEAYSSVRNEDSRGTRIRDALSLQEFQGGVGIPIKPSATSKLSEDTFQALLLRLNQCTQSRYIDEHAQVSPPGSLLLGRTSMPCKAIKVGGVTFQPEGYSLKNSNLLYANPHNHEITHAGIVIQIFIHRRSSAGSQVEETFLVVRRLKELEEAAKCHDHFRRYPKVGGSLYYDEYEPVLDIVAPCEILCHFARTAYHSPKIPNACVHVLPLDRVSHKSTDNV